MAAGSAGDPALRATIESALDEYRARFTDDRWQLYLSVHHERYQLLVADCLRLLRTGAAPADGRRRALVIGPRYEVDLLHRLAPDVVVDTLGLNPGLFPILEGEQFLPFDLNETDVPDRRPTPERYQLIVMAEVIEHLWTSPSVILPWLRSLLVPGGYLLVQTPNAVALPKRLRMLLGVNPFQELQTDRAYPGHIREYTVKEMAREGRNAGLEVAELRTANYFDSEKRTNRLYERMERVIPKNLRAGITVAYRRPDHG